MDATDAVRVSKAHDFGSDSGLLRFDSPGEADRSTPSPVPSIFSESGPSIVVLHDLRGQNVIEKLDPSQPFWLLSRLYGEVRHLTAPPVLN